MRMRVVLHRVADGDYKLHGYPLYLLRWPGGWKLEAAGKAQDWWERRPEVRGMVFPRLGDARGFLESLIATDPPPRDDVVPASHLSRQPDGSYVADRRYGDNVRARKLASGKWQLTGWRENLATLYDVRLMLTCYPLRSLYASC